MATALSQDVAGDYPTFIDGKEVWGSDRIEVRYPYSGEVIGSAPKLRQAEVTDALDWAATKRFDLSRYERSTLLNEIADKLEEDADVFARLITLDSGLSLKDTCSAPRTSFALR